MAGGEGVLSHHKHGRLLSASFCALFFVCNCTFEVDLCVSVNLAALSSSQEVTRAPGTRSYYYALNSTLHRYLSGHRLSDSSCLFVSPHLVTVKESSGQGCEEPKSGSNLCAAAKRDCSHRCSYLARSFSVWHHFAATWTELGSGCEAPL
jgi:hypothetical protein